MTTIKQILEWPVGRKGGGFVLTVKIAKKFWEIPQADGAIVGHHDDRRILVQQAILTDGTGDLLAELLLCSPEHGNHRSVSVGSMVRVIVCEVQQAYDAKGKDPKPGKKLYIEQYEDFVMKHVGRGEQPWGPNDDALEWDEYRKNEIRGKVRHGVVCAVIRASELREGMPEPTDSFKKDINAWVDFIMSGE